MEQDMCEFKKYIKMTKYDMFMEEHQHIGEMFKS